MKNNRLWALSLIVIGIITVIFAVTHIAGASLPDALVRILGIIELIMVALLAYTTVKKLRKK